MVSEPKRDPAEEREEIYSYIEERPVDRPLAGFNEEIGRIPAGPARGWRLREKKSKSCDACEGDLWIEQDNGELVPCACRERRAANRANSRLRAGGWWRGTSLSFAAPPLALISSDARDAVEALCADVKAGRSATGLWLVGNSDAGKSALCAYLAQRLYPSNDAIVEQVGDLLAHLRWLGAVKGEHAVEHRLQRLTETPLLVLDNVDRPVRSRQGAAPFAFESSCVSQDLIRLARLLSERRAAMRPIMLTSRAEPFDCHAQLASVTRSDLVRGLLGTACEACDPFEDFPAYTTSLLKGAMESVRSVSRLHHLGLARDLARAA